MKNLYKLFLVLVLIFVGFLLLLAGLKLIELALNLILYLGIALLTLSVIYYFIYPNEKGGE